MPATPSPALPYGNWTPALFLPHKRSIGGIVAEVTIEEQETDDLTITEHPIEQGAPINDHAFKRPSQVTIRAGWSVAGSQDLSAESGVYGLLLSWQAALMPFDLYTGKRAYKDMLMERLAVSTDETSEYALMATITCRQVVIVATQSTQVAGASDSSANHADPSTTAPSNDKGEQQARPAGNGCPSGQPDRSTAPISGEQTGAELGITPESANVQNQMNASGAAPPNDPPVDTQGYPQGSGLEKGTGVFGTGITGAPGS